MLRQRGFSLIELTVALLILGILLNYGYQAWSSTIQQEKLQQNQQQLEVIKNALLNHLKIHYHLPCPDTNSNGFENRKANGSCQKNYGTLPFLELGGINKNDVYGQPFLYAANQNSSSSTVANNMYKLCSSSSVFAKSGSYSNIISYCPDNQQLYCTNKQCENVCGTDLCNNNFELPRNQAPYFHRMTPPLGTSTAAHGALKVCSFQTDTCHNKTALSNLSANLVPAVIVSFGANGAQTWQNCQSANPVEQENCDNDAYFHQHPISKQFDDQLIWITIFEVKHALNHLIDWN